MSIDKAPNALALVDLMLAESAGLAIQLGKDGLQDGYAILQSATDHHPVIAGEIGNHLVPKFDCSSLPLSPTGK
jgi:hypothetical protein